MGTAPGPVTIPEQKAPVQRPRVRDGGKEAKLGSYERFRMDDEMQSRVLEHVKRGSGMRRYPA